MNDQIITPPENPDIEDILKDSERLFGKGQGLGANPTELKTLVDNAGFKYMSFGAWGNVYDIVKLSEKHSWFVNNEWNTGENGFTLNVGDIDFTSQKYQELNTYAFHKDATVANAVFKGPALMHYIEREYSPTREAIDFDYGTMELRFGQDIAKSTVSFIMSNSENNRIIDSKFLNKFSEDRKNVKVGYAEYYHEGIDSYVRIYHGYGTKQ